MPDDDSNRMRKLAAAAALAIIVIVIFVYLSNNSNSTNSSNAGSSNHDKGGGGGENMQIGEWKSVTAALANTSTICASENKIYAVLNRMMYMWNGSSWDMSVKPVDMLQQDSVAYDDFVYVYGGYLFQGSIMGDNKFDTEVMEHASCFCVDPSNNRQFFVLDYHEWCIYKVNMNLDKTDTQVLFAVNKDQPPTTLAVKDKTLYTVANSRLASSNDQSAFMTVDSAKESISEVIMYSGSIYALGTDGNVLQLQSDNTFKTITPKGHSGLKSLCANSSGFFAVDDKGVVYTAKKS